MVSQNYMNVTWSLFKFQQENHLSVAETNRMVAVMFNRPLKWYQYLTGRKSHMLVDVRRWLSCINQYLTKSDWKIVGQPKWMCHLCLSLPLYYRKEKTKSLTNGSVVIFFSLPCLLSLFMWCYSLPWKQRFCKLLTCTNVHRLQCRKSIRVSVTFNIHP